MDKAISSATTRSWISELNENDVLLGRGAVILKTEGHIRFRKLIQENRPQYTASSRHSVKHDIATRIMNIIASRGGRFVRKIETVADREKVGAPADGDAYMVVTVDASIQKIKQALREQESSAKSPPKSRKRKAANTKTEEEIDHADGASLSEAAHLPRKRAPAMAAAARAAGAEEDASEERPVTSPTVTSTAPSDQDLSFRLKHPSLRKRDLSRLRRQQEYSHLFTEGPTRSLSMYTLQGMGSHPLVPAPSLARAIPGPRDEAAPQEEGSKQSDAADSSGDEKPKAVDRSNKGGDDIA